MHPVISSESEELELIVTDKLRRTQGRFVVVNGCRAVEHLSFTGLKMALKVGWEGKVVLCILSIVTEGTKNKPANLHWSTVLIRVDQ